jgi:hypothetical protein
MKESLGLTHKPVVIGTVATWPDGTCDSLFAIFPADIERFRHRDVRRIFQRFDDVVANEPHLYPRRVIDAFSRR